QVPGLAPTRRPGIREYQRSKRSAAPLGHPLAGAGAVAAAPGAAARFADQPAGAGRSLVAGADVHGERAVLADLAADADIGAAGVEHVALADADRIAIARVADPELGHDDHAPDPVVARDRFGRPQRGKCRGG